MSKQLIDKLRSVLDQDELKTIYFFMQSLKLLSFFIWSFSQIAIFFVINLLHPKSILINWSSNHIYLVGLSYILLLYVPTSFLFLLTSRFDPSKILPSVKGSYLAIISPRNVWILGVLISCAFTFFLAFIISISY